MNLHDDVGSLEVYKAAQVRKSALRRLLTRRPSKQCTSCSSVMKVKPVQVLVVVAIQLAVVLTAVATHVDDDDNLRSLLGDINREEHKRSEKEENVDEAVNKTVDNELSDAGGCFYENKLYQYGEIIHDNGTSKITCSGGGGVMQYDYGLGKNLKGRLPRTQESVLKPKIKRSVNKYSKKTRPADKRPCPDGMRDDGTSCWKDTYTRGVGRVPDKANCPSSQRDDGTSCWLDTYGRGAGRIPDKQPCPSGLRDDGTSCWSDAHIYGKGCCCWWGRCCKNCRSGYHDDGCTCRKTNIGIKMTLFARYRCKSNEDMNGVRCYPKCKSGYHAVGCCLCSPNGGPGIKKTLRLRQSCKSTEERSGALCYPKCKDGYSPVGCCLCQPHGGPGIKKTLPQRQYCKENEDLDKDNCWEKCKTGYIDDGRNNCLAKE